MCLSDNRDRDGERKRKCERGEGESGTDSSNTKS